jgi:LemA protein
MNTTLAFILIVILVGGTIWIYNHLIKLRNMVAEGLSAIDVQLLRRANLIPNLEQAVKGYMGHERALLTEIAELRARSREARGVGDKAEAEMGLSKALAGLVAVAESYPDLKANQNFLALQRELSDIEDQIQMARRYYNGTVRNLNIAVESFPSLIIARLGGFKAAEFFAAESDDRAVPKLEM